MTCLNEPLSGDRLSSKKKIHFASKIQLPRSDRLRNSYKCLKIALKKTVYLNIIFITSTVQIRFFRKRTHLKGSSCPTHGIIRPHTANAVTTPLQGLDGHYSFASTLYQAFPSSSTEDLGSALKLYNTFYYEKKSQELMLIPNTMRIAHCVYSVDVQ